jgi:hypothetical protein
MTVPTITTLPDFPVRGEDPVTFAQKANDSVAAYPTMVTEMNAMGEFVEDEAAAAEAARLLAQAAATSAQAAQTAAQAASNATAWVSGATYAAGAVVWSLIDFQSYRALVSTSGTTDPSLSADWTLLSGNVTTTGTQTLTNKTLTDPAIIGTILEDVYTISDGAEFEIDPGNGSIQLITLGASRTPKATNFAAGEAITLMVDDGTDYAITWTDATWGGSGVIWATDGGVAPTLNATGFTSIVLWKVSTQVYGARVGDA